MVAVAAGVFLLRVCAGVWSPDLGLTRFLLVGGAWHEVGTTAFRATPKYIDPYPSHRFGFDGQFYAQIALDPLLRNPELRTAIDDPAYRARRILLPWLAWLGGLGRPAWVINVFAGLNLVFWIAYAWLAARLFRPPGWSGLAGYAAVLLTCGVIESIRGALTDFPGFVLMTAAVVAGGTAGAGLLAAAALTRETCALGFLGLLEARPPWRDAFRKNLVRGVVAVAPLLLWIAYVLWRFRDLKVDFTGGNFAWPLQGIMEKLGEFSVTAVHGPIRWHRWFFELYKSYDLHAVLTIVAVLTQCVYLALHRAWADWLWRMAATFAVYLLCISFLSWESHFTVTRHALPVTLVFNLLLAARPGRGWLVWFVLGNCFVPYGLYAFARLPVDRAPAQPAEYVVVAPAGAAAPMRVVFTDGWSPQQWNPHNTWRWAAGPAATLAVHNDSTRSARAQISFVTRTRQPRTLTVRAGNGIVLSRHLPAGREVLTIPSLELPPGETRLFLISPEPPSDTDDGTPGKVTFMVGNPVIRLEQRTSSPSR